MIQAPELNPDPVTAIVSPGRPSSGFKVMDAAATGVAGITNASSEIIMTTTKTRKILLYFI